MGVGFKTRRGGVGGGYALVNPLKNFEVESIGDGVIRILIEDPDDKIIDGQPIAIWGKTLIIAKKSSYPLSEKDGIVFADYSERNKYKTNPLEVTGLDNGDDYHIMAIPITDKGVITMDVLNRLIATPSDGDDTSGSPGSMYLISGDMNAGFFGEVPSLDFVDGTTLASAISLSAGTAFNATSAWLKYAYDGKICFTPKAPFRYNLSWDHINTAKAVYGDPGDATYAHNGLTYKVRLFRATDPTNNPKTAASANSGVINHYSEWNKIMCMIHEQAINGSWNYTANVEQSYNILTHTLGTGTNGMYKDSDIWTHNSVGNGTYNWCQEMATSTSNRLTRGLDGVSYSSGNASSGTTTIFG